jgi:hypothetical protein
MLRRSVCVAVLGLAIALHGFAALAADPTPPEAAPIDDDPDVDPDARDLLKRAADFLRSQQHFSFSADVAFEVYQNDGSTLEFGELREYLVRRPDRLRVSSQRRALGKRVIYFDGDRITVSVPDQKAYALVKLKTHRNIDDALHLVRDRLGLPMPLGELLASDLGKGLEGSFDSGFVVGDEVLDGVDVKHVALRNELTDIELWVKKGDQPYVERVHIAYSSLPGEPRFTARLSNWSLTPDVADKAFAFDAPADFERVRFAFGGSGTPPTEATKTQEKKP